MAGVDAAGWSTVSQAYAKTEYLMLPFARTLVHRVQSVRNLREPEAAAFDNGCGTGVLTSVLKHHYPDLPVLASDISEGMVDVGKSRASMAGWKTIRLKVIDGRNLEPIAADTFSHTFSTFMICLAAEPDVIAKEMYRVTQPGGVLGLAVWGEPYFVPFNTPWTKACRRFIPGYQPLQVMGSAWTRRDEIEAGLKKAGFIDIVAREEEESWSWESVGVMLKYFFDGGNPGNEAIIRSFSDQGGQIEEVRPEFEQVMREDHAGPGESIQGTVMACLATARK